MPDGGGDLWRKKIKIPLMTKLPPKTKINPFLCFKHEIKLFSDRLFKSIKNVKIDVKLVFFLQIFCENLNVTAWVGTHILMYFTKTHRLGSHAV